MKWEEKLQNNLLLKSSMPKIQELEEVDILENTANAHNLIVWNDEVNTFEHVINVLIKVCKHSNEQAEQCTILIHYKGKAQVKKGTYDALKPMKEAILNEGINATIE
jgi:ATP-dependent Clp protease adaptor protein ClpS